MQLHSMIIAFDTLTVELTNGEDCSIIKMMMTRIRSLKLIFKQLLELEHK